MCVSDWGGTNPTVTDTQVAREKKGIPSRGFLFLPHLASYHARLGQESSLPACSTDTGMQALQHFPFVFLQTQEWTVLHHILSECSCRSVKSRCVSWVLVCGLSTVKEITLCNIKLKISNDKQTYHLTLLKTICQTEIRVVCKTNTAWQDHKTP